MNSVRKCQLLVLQDQLYYEINLSQLNQQNHIDYSARSVSGYGNIQNLKENSKKNNDKKVQSATNRIYEKEHDEFTIKSAANYENNIKVQPRIVSARKPRVEENIDQNLNDSKLKKSQNQKIEKLNIEIKETI